MFALTHSAHPHSYSNSFRRLAVAQQLYPASQDPYFQPVDSFRSTTQSTVVSQQDQYLPHVPAPAMPTVAQPPGQHEGYAYLMQLATARQRRMAPAPLPVADLTAPSTAISNLRTAAPTVAPTARQPQTQYQPVAQTQKVQGPRLTNPKDWHIPSLDETFKLAKKYPGKKIYLDTKTSDKPEVGRRMANQIMDLLKKHPEMKSRVVILNPSNKVLNVMKEEFKKRPEFRYFKNFSLDNENLNKRSPSAKERSPLTNSGDNKYVSIGNPKNPLTSNNFKDLVKEIKKTRAQTSNPNSPHHGKKILAWTINDPKRIRELVKAGADGILTDDVEKMKKTLDKMGLPANKRPEIIAHRGGSNSKKSPENTLPRIEDGLRSSADAIEIDVVSAKDGAVVYHDNDPNGLDAVARNIGAEASNKWRPTFPDLASPLRYKRLDQLTMSQIRKNYGFERNATSSIAANLLGSAVEGALSLPGSWLENAGKALGFKPLTETGRFLSSVVDKVGKPIIRGGVQALDKIATGAWQGVATAGKGLWNGVGSIFKGKIAKGLGQIGTGLWKGGVKLVSNVGKGAWSLVKGIGKAASNVGKGIVKGAKKAWKGVKKFFKGLFG
jgi:glycerophosphoryl diester phosphodiesterase